MADHRRVHPEVADLEAGRKPAAPRAAGNASRCLCRAVLAITVIAAALAAALGILYMVFDPKLPRYTVARLVVTTFDMDNDLAARARLDVAVRAENPNRAIGISYEAGSRLGVWYGEHRLCEGALPAFYQAPREARVVRVDMGEARLGGAGVRQAVRQLQQTGGAMAVALRGDVPVRVRLGAAMLWRVTARVRCELVVDRLEVDSPIRVKSMSCKFGLKL